jgi:hypothetical protein
MEVTAFSTLGSLLESGMLIAFGFAWPANIAHTLRRKSAVGKSASFLIIIIIGYIFGIGSKIARQEINYVFILYLINLAMVSCDLFLYFYYKYKEEKRM